MSVRLQGHWLERPWGRMRVWTAGEGPPLLAVHGLGGSGRYWRGLADRLPHRRVIAPDLAGFGASDKPALAYDRAFHRDNLEAVAVAFAPEGRLTVVGHSIGGTLAALWAGPHADRLDAIVLAAAPFPTGRGFDPARVPTHAREGRRVAETVVRGLWPVLAVPVGLARGYPAAVTVDFGRQTRLANRWTLGSVLYDPGVTGDLEAVRTLAATRGLILHAADDRRIRMESQRRWSELLTAADVVTVPNGGHQFLLRTGFASVVTWLEA